jgi:transcriptional regulator with XRE-family HTH domain
MEKEMILEARKRHGSSRNVARALGISQSRASRLIRKHCPGRASRKRLASRLRIGATP